MIYDKFNNITDDRIVASLIGMTKAKFSALVGPFAEADRAIQNERVGRGEIKHVKYGKTNGYLDTHEKKLFFVLYYLKTYPTFDVLGFHFGFSGGHAHAHIDRLLPVLQRALTGPRGDAGAVDGVECACVRPQDPADQENHYSGKLRHTVKSLAVSDLNRKILLLCAVVAGSVHDYALMKQVFKPGLPWFRKVGLWLDLGFLGADKDYDANTLYLPHKKPRKSKKYPNPALNPTQNRENRRQASTRVAVEHAIGGMKGFHCLVHRIRNHLNTFVDAFFALSAGLWNYKISEIAGA